MAPITQGCQPCILMSVAKTARGTNCASRDSRRETLRSDVFYDVFELVALNIKRNPLNLSIGKVILNIQRNPFNFINGKRNIVRTI